MACHLVTGMKASFMLHADTAVMGLAAHDRHHNLLFMSASREHIYSCVKYQGHMDLDLISVSHLQHSHNSYKQNWRSLRI